MMLADRCYPAVKYHMSNVAARLRNALIDPEVMCEFLQFDQELLLELLCLRTYV